MNTQFECTDQVNGLLTITLEPSDYQGLVAKKLKEISKKVHMPGFRPGMVPVGLIKKQYGTSVKVDEVNRLVGDAINKYITDNKLRVLGNILPSEEKQQPQDMAVDGPLEFIFDVAIAPDFKVELTQKDKLNFYSIIADDKLIDEQVRMFAAQSGQMVEAQEWSGNDTLVGDLRQLDAEGNTLEGGITVEGGQVMPSYIKDEEQKKKFEGAKPGDIILFNPKKAYPDNDAEVAGLLKVKKEEVADLTADFSYQITEISRFTPAALDQKLFDQVFGEGAVKDEKEFRQKIAESLKPQLTENADYKFLLDVRAHMEKKVGKLEFPDALLKRIMLNNNKDKGADFVEKNYEQSIVELKWHLIKEQLVAAQDIKVDEADLKSIAKEAARAQFAQYGMTNVPDEYLENYANDMLKKRENVDGLVDRAVDAKLIAALKKVVKLNEKSITLEDFNKMMQEK